jgi:hypothetical protein
VIRIGQIAHLDALRLATCSSTTEPRSLGARSCSHIFTPLPCTGPWAAARVAARITYPLSIPPRFREQGGRGAGPQGRLGRQLPGTARGRPRAAVQVPLPTARRQYGVRVQQRYYLRQANCQWLCFGCTLEQLAAGWTHPTLWDGPIPLSYSECRNHWQDRHGVTPRNLTRRPTGQPGPTVRVPGSGPTGLLESLIRESTVALKLALAAQLETPVP